MKRLWILLTILASSLILSGCNLTKPKKAGLQVITNNVSASVFINDQYADKTPYSGRELQPGTYTVRIEPDNPDLVAHETTVTLNPGLLTVITWKPGTRPETSGGVIYEMERLPGKKQTKLSIISLPDGAIVSVDNQQKEFTPYIDDTISAGQHEFEVTLPSYETQKHTINVIEGHQMNITIKLAKVAQNTEQLVEETPVASDSGELSVLGAETENATPAAAAATPAAVRRRTALSSSSGPTVTILPTNYFNDGQEVLRVRSEPSSVGAEAGFAEVGQTYSYLNERQNGWYKIEFDGKVGWVSGQYAELNETSQE